ncbi:uncharacterized protein BXZ73DRAFT_96209 [Epithele typhae]|uniref:uncharacterized protein n=1 Tax=Epithele typhae TaxID=378194 RepID=UPI002008B275|nr:uncharacterized protein BXZ73DRAFT_96209 [Epithele typhae]KAH9945218.1 hypothetical protein BXZ73DRAFT_96209 [Epithele typhae]
MIEQILDELDDQGDAVQTLKDCARVCSAWLPRARYHLWRKLTIDHPEKITLMIEAFNHAPELCKLVRTVRLRAKDCPRDTNFPYVAPVILLPYLAHIDTWEVQHTLQFPLCMLAALRQYTAVRKLVLECRMGYLPSSVLQLGKLLCAFPALQELSVSADMFGNNAAESIMRSLQNRVRLRLQKVKLQLHSSPSSLLHAFVAACASNVVDLTLGAHSLGAEGLDMSNFPCLEHLTLQVKTDDIRILRELRAFPTINGLLDLGIPRSLRSLDIVINSEALYWFGVALHQDQLATISKFTRLIENHDCLRAHGVTCTVESSKENYTNIWVSTLEQVFSSLHDQGLLRIVFTHPTRRNERLLGHTGIVDIMTTSQGEQWAASSATLPGQMIPVLRSVIVWDMHTNRTPTFALEYLFQDEMAYSRDLFLIFAPSGNRLMYFAKLTYQVWVFDLPRRGDRTSGNQAKLHAQTDITQLGRILGAAWTPDSTHIVVSIETGDVHLWDAETLTHVRALTSSPLSTIIPGPEYNQYTFASLSLSVDGRTVLCHFFDSVLEHFPRPLDFHDHVFTWNLASGTCRLRRVAYNPDAVSTSAALWSGSHDVGVDVLTLTVSGKLQRLESAADEDRDESAPPPASAVGSIIHPFSSSLLNENGWIIEPTSAAAQWRTVLAECGQMLALSTDGTRALCHASSGPGAHTYSIVDTATGEPVYPPLRTRSELGVFTPSPGSFSRDVQALAVSCDGPGVGWRSPLWFWRVQEGRLYRIPVSKHVYAGSMVFADAGSWIMFYDTEEKEVRFYSIFDQDMEEADVE